MNLDKILEDLAKHGIYVNKDKINLMRYLLQEDGTELYIIYFENYKAHIKIFTDNTVRVYTYPIMYSKKKQSG